VVVVAHQAVLRIVYAYFMMMDKTKAPTISIPLNTVIKLVPKNHGCDEGPPYFFNLKDSIENNSCFTLVDADYNG